MKGRVALLTFAAIAFIVIPVMISIGVPVGRSGFATAAATGVPPPVAGPKPADVPEVSTGGGMFDTSKVSPYILFGVPVVILVIIVVVISPK